MQPSWTRVIAASLARSVLVAVVGLLLCAVVPAAAGWHTSVVMTGSMQPAIAPGDVIVDRHPGDAFLQPGQVLVIDDPDAPGRLRIHRLVRADGHGDLVTRGDANPKVDSTPVAPHKVRGVAVLRVPWMGSPVVWVTDHDWVALIAAVLAVAMTLYLSTLDRRRRRPPSPPPTRPWLRRSRAAIAASAVIAAGAATSSTDATDAAFAASTRNTGDTLSAATSFSPYQDAVTADAPFLYWRLNETSGTLAGDSSGQAYTGTYYGTYSQSQPSALATEPYDSSVLFNAGHVSGRSATTGPATFTLEVWIKTTTTSGGAILGFGSGSGSTSGATVDRQLYMAPSGNVVLGLGATRSVIGSPTALNDGRWHHLAGTYSAVNGAILYVDGTRVATSPGAVPVPLTGRWRVAYQPLSNWPTPPTSDYFTGIVDEVAVYTTTLSPSRVQAHYTAATT